MFFNVTLFLVLISVLFFLFNWIFIKHDLKKKTGTIK